MKKSDQPGRGAEAPQERLSSLIEAIRRIGASLDVATVLWRELGIEAHR